MRQARGQGNGQGLNENLAREILELHTLGVRSGNSQEDVTELARALTGWTLPGDEASEELAASFRFVAGLHEPGSRTVLAAPTPPAVQGGRVLADWPGLAPANLLDGRDLRPTLALESLIAQACAEAFQVEPGKMAWTLFPHLVQGKPLPRLLKA